MNLYLVSQDINNDYDTYNSVVVAATSEAEAKDIHPSNLNWCEYTWVKQSEKHLLKVQLIGTTHKSKGVVLASFRAG